MLQGARKLKAGGKINPAIPQITVRLKGWSGSDDPCDGYAIHIE